MMNVVVTVNVMVFCVMINMVIVDGGNLPTGNLPVLNKDCNRYHELELAKGVKGCPRGKPREYISTYSQTSNGPISITDLFEIPL